MSNAIQSSGGSNGWWISASGMTTAMQSMDAVASHVANSNTDDFVPVRIDATTLPGGGISGVVVMGNAGMLSSYQGPSLTDYTTEGVSLILAKLAFEANARVFKTESEISGTIGEIMG